MVALVSGLARGVERGNMYLEVDSGEDARSGE